MMVDLVLPNSPRTDNYFNFTCISIINFDNITTINSPDY